MSGELVLYTHPMSRGRTTRWMLEEVGQPYRAEILDYAGSLKSPAYLAINPMGKVPALRHGDVVVTEVAAICAYLADAFPEPGLAPPPSDPRRGAYYRWFFFAAGPLESAVTNTSLGVVMPEGKDRMAGYGSLALTLDTVEAAVSAAPYLTGESFSAADLYLGSHLGWGMMFGTIEKRPAFEAYWQRVSQRPALARANAIDDVLLAKEGA